MPSQLYLGSVGGADKTNEIVAARELCARLDLDGKTVRLDALHTQDQTARELVLDHDADYLLTVKGNHPTVLANIERVILDPCVPFFHPPPARSAGSNAPSGTKAALPPARW